MLKKIILLFISLLSVTMNSQTITGSQLIEKSIQYHDPNGNWSTFNGVLNVTMKSPNTSDRASEITINLPQQYFHVAATKDSITTEYTVDKGHCKIALNGRSNLTVEELKTYNLTCERAELYKNYYTYLYGLPMKLKDNGTIIEDKVERKLFKGKLYLVTKVTYDKAVGSDVWYFYFDPKTYAMEVYQFFKTDDDGKLKPNSGEYILLNETETISAIKIPKTRAWYYNKDDGYLGTDTLNKE